MTQDRALERRERILDAALDVFSDRGFRDAAVDDVAQASSTSKGGVYFHFPGKEALFLALLDRTAARLVSKIERAMEDHTGAVARADAALDAVIGTFSRHRALARLFMVETLGAGKTFHRRMAEVRADFAAVISEQLQRAVDLGEIAPVDTAIAGQAWFGAVNEVITQWVLADQPSSLDDACAALRPLLHRSIGLRGAVAIRPAAEIDDQTVRRLRQRLLDLVPEANSVATERDRQVLISAAFRLPAVDAISLFSRSDEISRSYWHDPRHEMTIVGLGAAARFEHRGQDGCGLLRQKWQETVATSLTNQGGCPLQLPLASAGLAFDPGQSHADEWRSFPNGELLIPRLVLVTSPQGAWLAGNVVIGSEEQTGPALADLHRVVAGLNNDSECEPDVPPDADDVDGRSRWGAAVEAACTAIRAGDLDKVVLARELSLHSPVGFAPGLALRRLQARYPQCTVFAVAREGDVFLGASPETLARLDHGRLEVTCLAGSRRRGESPSSDAAEGASLLADAKERHEHAVVLEALHARLATVCDRLEGEAQPDLLRMVNVQHLHTRLSGVVSDSLSLLDLVELLHPTPATAGEPREPALEFIRGIEPFARGWYAGAVGWISPSGGEAVVAIRSALVRGSRARLYAGCGIVADSQPDREYRESCLKLEPMLWALGGPVQ